MKSVRALLKTMRPKQWTKNVFIFAALVFDEKIFISTYFWPTCLGFVLFCLVSGVVYTINDVIDIEKDRHHPKKQHRPLASGKLTPNFALAAAAVIATLSLLAAFWLNSGFFFILLVYLGLQIAYSLYLKHIVLLDVLCIAGGFVLRVAGGVPLVNAERFSPWLYICMTLAALFLGMTKRRGELVLLGDKAATHRKVLGDYNIALLDQLLGVITSMIIMAYTLYTFSAPNLPTNYSMMLTVPFVIYGLFRYMYLIHVKGLTLPPDEVLLTDRPFLVDILLWGLTTVLILYFG